MLNFQQNHGNSITKTHVIKSRDPELYRTKKSGNTNGNPQTQLFINTILIRNHYSLQFMLQTPH